MAAAVCQDEEVVLAASFLDSPLCVWDLATGALTHSFASRSAAKNGLCCAGPDHLASTQPMAADGKSATISCWTWHKKNAQLVRSHMPEPIGPLAGTSDGLFLFGGSATGRVYVWEMSTGRLLRSWAAHYKAVAVMRVSEDDTLLVTGGDDTFIHVTPLIRIMDGVNQTAVSSSSSLPSSLATGPTSAAPAPMYSWQEHQQGVTGLHVGRGGGNAVLVSSSTDRTCKFWSLALGQLLGSYTFPAAVNAVTMHPIEHSVYAGGANGLVFRSALNFTAPECDVQFEGHVKAVTALGFSSSGTYLLSASEDCTVRVWDNASIQCVRTLTHCKGPISCLLVLPKRHSRPDALRTSQQQQQHQDQQRQHWQQQQHQHAADQIGGQVGSKGGQGQQKASSQADAIWSNAAGVREGLNGGASETAAAAAVSSLMSGQSGGFALPPLPLRTLQKYPNPRPGLQGAEPWEEAPVALHTMPQARLQQHGSIGLYCSTSAAGAAAAALDGLSGLHGGASVLAAAAAAGNPSVADSHSWRFLVHTLPMFMDTEGASVLEARNAELEQELESANEKLRQFRALYERMVPEALGQSADGPGAAPRGRSRGKAGPASVAGAGKGLLSRREQEGTAGQAEGAAAMEEDGDTIGETQSQQDTRQKQSLHHHQQQQQQQQKQQQEHTMQT